MVLKPTSIEPDKPVRANPWKDINPTGPIFRPREAAAYYGVSLSSYYELIQAGELPQFIKLGGRARASGVPRPWLDAVIAHRATAARGGNAK